jgi:hypothetical protein
MIVMIGYDFAAQATGRRKILPLQRVRVTCITTKIM